MEYFMWKTFFPIQPPVYSLFTEQRRLNVTHFYLFLHSIIMMSDRACLFCLFIFLFPSLKMSSPLEVVHHSSLFSAFSILIPPYSLLLSCILHSITLSLLLLPRSCTLFPPSILLFPLFFSLRLCACLST